MKAAAPTDTRGCRVQSVGRREVPEGNRTVTRQAVDKMRSAIAPAAWVAGMALAMGAHGADPPAPVVSQPGSEHAVDSPETPEVPRILERAVTSEISTGSKTLDVLLNLPPGALGGSAPVRSPAPPITAPPAGRGTAGPFAPPSEILQRNEQAEAEAQAIPPELQRPKWSGTLGGGIGTRDAAIGSRGSEGDATDADLRRLLPRWMVDWLRENRDTALYTAVAGVLLAGLAGWAREKWPSRHRASGHRVRHRRRPRLGIGEGHATGHAERSESEHGHGHRHGHGSGHRHRHRHGHGHGHGRSRDGGGSEPGPTGSGGQQAG